MGKSFYEVVSPIRFGGRDREIGDTVEMDDDLAATQGSRLRLVDEPAIDVRNGEVITKAKLKEMGEEYVARVQSDLAECQRLRDEATTANADATRLFDEAKSEKAKADELLAEANKAREDAAADLAQAIEHRKAADDALTEAKKLKAEKAATKK